MIPRGDEVDGIGGDDAVEGRQRKTSGDVGLEEVKPGAGKVSLHGGAQHLEAGPVPIYGDNFGVWTGNVAEREGEGAAACAEIGPDATTIPLNAGLNQLDVIGVVHEMTSLKGVDTGPTGE